MTNYVIDAYAWIEYLGGTEPGKKVRQIVEDKQNIIYTSAVTLAEVVSKVRRSGRDAGIGFEAVTVYSKVVPVDYALAFATGSAHAEMRKTIPDFGLADAFVLETAKQTNAKIVTGDPHFKGIKDTVYLGPK